MTQYKTLNVKFSHSQLNKLKSGIKNGTEVNWNLSSNVTGSSNKKINFPHKLILTDRRVSNLPIAFTNNSSVNMNFSKTQLSKMVQLGRILTLPWLPLYD